MPAMLSVQLHRGLFHSRKMPSWHLCSFFSWRREEQPFICWLGSGTFDWAGGDFYAEGASSPFRGCTLAERNAVYMHHDERIVEPVAIAKARSKFNLTAANEVDWGAPGLADVWMSSISFNLFSILIKSSSDFKSSAKPHFVNLGMRIGRFND